MRRLIVVVTGSTKGLGLGLVESFLARGCSVVVSGRRDVDAVTEDLAKRHDPARILGVPCDVSNRAEVEALHDRSLARFGAVDVWINNAGTSNPQTPFVEQTPEMIEAVVKTNLLGVMHGTQVALGSMLRRGRGAVYNMEGYGADGARRVGMALYGSSKSALRYFTRSVAGEVRSTGVQVCTLSPGIVVTELLTSVYAAGDPENWRKQRWLFNFIADPWTSSLRGSRAR
jgi:NAD(P)-dependent dehydrogenase (short-subunit alcohol dehydrogenase family)